MNFDSLAEKRRLEALEFQESNSLDSSMVNGFDDEKYTDYWDDPPAEFSGISGGPPAFYGGKGPSMQLIPRVFAVATVKMQTAYEELQESLLKLIKVAQGVDPFIRERQYKVASNQQQDAGHALRADGVLAKDCRIYIPPDSSLRAEILRLSHDDPHNGHFGIAKTTSFIQHYYHGDTLLSDVKEYVSTCAVCQRTKAVRHQPHGGLASLPQPKGLWQEISMNFITDLP